MGSRNKERSRKSSSYERIAEGFITKGSRNKERSRKEASCSKHKRTSHDVKHFELKDMKKLERNDEAFHLSFVEIEDILDIIRSRKTPTFETYKRWDKYAQSFYLKMCTCFGVDYQHLEAPSERKHSTKERSLKEEQEEQMEYSGVDLPSTKEMSNEELSEEQIQERVEALSEKKHSTKERSLKEEQEEQMECSGMNQPSTKEMSAEELSEEQIQELRKLRICRRMTFKGPFKFGSYSSGTTPDRIPYHLYLLVKEAVDIMGRNNTKDLTDLKNVEKKISFFCHYFHSHLPTGWNYDRDNARSLIAGYDTTVKPRDLMAGYTPIHTDEHLWVINYEEESELEPQEMMEVMSIIHSRKAPPTLRIFNGALMSFYCSYVPALALITIVWRPLLRMMCV